MKKVILSISAMAGVCLAGHAQQIDFADNSANTYDVSINGTPDTTQDLNLELLVGATSTSVTTDVVTLLLNGASNSATTALGTTQSAVGDITQFGGTIYDKSANGYVMPAGSAFAQVLAWTGNFSSFAAAEGSGQVGVYAGSSSVFSIPVIGVTSPPDDISSITPFNITQVPTAVPEPGTLAMAGVGLASMLIFRRKK